MNCFGFLGLSDDADERAIKRAYARAIKVTRPDDDAAGFQALNEAYQFALHVARRREADKDNDEDPVDTDVAVALELQERPALAEVAIQADVPPLTALSLTPMADATADYDRVASASAADTGTQSVPEPEGESFDFSEFYREVLFRGGRDRSRDFRAWLHSIGALYNFDLKDHVGQHVQYWLVHDENGTPLRSSNLAALGEFFGIDIDSGLASMNTARWAIAHEDTGHYGEPRPAIIRQLKRPYSGARALALAAIPGWSSRMAALGRRLSRDYGELPPGIEPGQFELARLLTMPSYLGRFYWAMMCVRGGLAMLALLAVLVPFTAVATLPDMPWLSLIWSLTFGIGVFIGSAIWRGVNFLRHLPARSDTERLSRDVAFPAALALGGIALSLLMHQSLTGLLTSALAMVLTARHWVRSWDALRLTVAGLWSHSALTALPFDASTFGFALGFGALALLACDIAYARRHDIPLRAAAAGNRWTLTVSYVLFAAGLVLKQAIH